MSIPVCASRSGARTGRKDFFRAVRIRIPRPHVIRANHRRTDRMDDLVAIRRWYAEDLRLRTPVRRNMATIDAFAAVPRERFLGPGPWQIVPFSQPDQPFTTADAAPHWLYHDVLVAIDPARHLNNGMPSFWAHNLDQLDLQRGERVLQVGAGTGYYSGILAEMVR